VYRVCTAPISSFGIICYRRKAGSVEYLMVQRNDSLSYVEFIRGKYSIQNRSYVKRLLSNMTVDERTRIVSHSFEDLWHMFWQPDSPGSVRRHQSQRNTKEFFHSKTRFNILKDGYYLRSTDLTTPEFFNLNIALEQTTSDYTDTEFGFPKGRRNINEKDVHCAYREFTEETDVASSHIKLIGSEDPIKYEELFVGSNNVWYRHVYYIAELQASSDQHLKTTNHPIAASNPVQTREIKATIWMSYEEALKSIRESHTQRRNLLTKVHQYVSTQPHAS
jgi:ADP-ribose pyrophosphatase YjhB (NUDIX family)